MDTITAKSILLSPHFLNQYVATTYSYIKRVFLPIDQKKYTTAYKNPNLMKTRLTELIRHFAKTTSKISLEKIYIAPPENNKDSRQLHKDMIESFFKKI